MADVQKLGQEIKLQVDIDQAIVVESKGSSSMDPLKARLSFMGSGNDSQHVEYNIRVGCEGKYWCLRKRFKDFSNLHDSLKRHLPSVPELPSKTAVRQFSTEYIEQRKRLLNQYLQDIARRRDAVNCREVQHFLGLHQNIQTLGSQQSEPVQAAEVTEAAFGIVDFDYDADQGILLIGSADCSWSSRLDTKITNIKLPWEPTAPDLPTAQMSLWKQSPADLRFSMIWASKYKRTISCVVMCSGQCFCGLSDGTVGYRAINGERGVATNGPTVPLLKYTSGVAALAADESEKWLIAASKDNVVTIYDIAKRIILTECTAASPATTLWNCPEQRRLFCGLKDGGVSVYDTSAMPMQHLGVIQKEGLKASPVLGLHYDAASSTLFTASKEGGYQLYAVKSSNQSCWGRSIGNLPIPAQMPTNVAYMPSSREVVGSAASGAVVVYDLERGEAAFSFQAHNVEITSMLWLDAPRRLLTASKDKSLKIWDFPTARNLSGMQSLGDLGIDVGSPPPAPMLTRATTRETRQSVSLVNEEPQAAGYSNQTSAPLPHDSRTSSLFGDPCSTQANSSGLDPLRSLQGGGRATAAAAAPMSEREEPARVSVSTRTSTVAGSKPNALIRDDSDDDLAGWAR